MDYRRIGLAKGGPQDWGQEEAAKQQGAANVAASNPYSNVAQQQNRALNERVSREGRSNISRRNYQQGVKDFYKEHQGGIGGGIRNIGGGIRNFFGGLKDKFGAWAGNMRGGINPATNTWYTQDEYEQNRQNRRNQASIDRIRKTKGLYDSGVIDRDWDQSPLKDRLAGLEKGQWDRMSAMGMPIGTTKPGEGQGIETINNGVNLNDFEGVNFNERIAPDTAGSLTRSGMKNMEIANNPNLQYTSDMSVRPVSTWSERVGNRLGVDLQEADFVRPDFLQEQPWIDEKMGLRNKLFDLNPPLDIQKFKESYESPLTYGKYLNAMKEGKVPESLRESFNKQFLEKLEDKGGLGRYNEGSGEWENVFQDWGFGTVDPTFQPYGTQGGMMLDVNPDKLSIKDMQKMGTKPSDFLIGIAQGGRVGYNTGGRVGILAAF